MPGVYINIDKKGIYEMINEQKTMNHFFRQGRKEGGEIGRSGKEGTNKINLG